MPSGKKRPTIKSEPGVKERKPDILNLVGLKGPLKGVVFDRRDTKILVGRDKGRWKLSIDDDYISQRHARIYWDDAASVWMIMDRGSTNGTYVNLVEIGNTAVELRDGDIVDFSETNRFEVQISPCPEGLTKREFLTAEVEIFARRLKAQSEMQITRLLQHWRQTKIKLLQKAGYCVEYVVSGSDEK